MGEVDARKNGNAATGGPSANFIGIHVIRTTNQTALDNTVTPISWSSTEYNEGSAFVVSGTTLTLQAGFDGDYRFLGEIHWADGSDGWRAALALKNGVASL